MATIWTDPIHKCKLCGLKITESFIHGKTKAGRIAVMCDLCNKIAGSGEGVEYQKLPDGRYAAVA
jgi:hypothetical protein